MRVSNLILIVGFGLLVTLCGCRVNHKMSGEVDANTNNTVRVEVDCPICNVPEWSFEQKTECLRICLNPTVGATADEEIKDLLKESTTEPTNVMGGV